MASTVFTARAAIEAAARSVFENMMGEEESVFQTIRLCIQACTKRKYWREQVWGDKRIEIVTSSE